MKEVKRDMGVQEHLEEEEGVEVGARGDIGKVSWPLKRKDSFCGPRSA